MHSITALKNEHKFFIENRVAHESGRKPGDSRCESRTSSAIGDWHLEHCSTGELVLGGGGVLL